jgi:hypothetical protein
MEFLFRRKQTTPFYTVAPKIILKYCHALGWIIRLVLDWMIGFIARYTFTQFGSTDNYSSIAILHTFQLTVAQALGFSAFTSRILTMDCSQSHCNFKSHTKSSFHSLIPFLPLFCNCQFRRPIRLLSASVRCPFMTPRYWPHRKHSLYFWRGVLTALLHSNRPSTAARFGFAGICFPSRCLAMGIHVTILNVFVSPEETISTANVMHVKWDWKMMNGAQIRIWYEAVTE